LAVRIRLLRMGKKKRPFYRIVVTDSRVKRDGKYIEKIGYYDPIPDPSIIKIDREKAINWLKKGAQPTDTVYSLFKKEGIALEWHLIKNNVDEKTRNIEIQKWEMAKKLKEEAKRKKEEPAVEEEISVGEELERVEESEGEKTVIEGNAEETEKEEKLTEAEAKEGKIGDKKSEGIETVKKTEVLTEETEKEELNQESSEDIKAEGTKEDTSADNKNKEAEGQ